MVKLLKHSYDTVYCHITERPALVYSMTSIMQEDSFTTTLLALLALILFKIYQSYSFFFFSFFKYILLIMLLWFSQFLPIYPLSTLHPPTHQHSPPLVHVHVLYIYKLSSLFPIPFLISPCLFYAYQLLLIPCTFHPYSFPPSPH